MADGSPPSPDVSTVPVGVLTERRDGEPRGLGEHRGAEPETVRSELRQHGRQLVDRNASRLGELGLQHVVLVPNGREPAQHAAEVADSPAPLHDSRFANRV